MIKGILANDSQTANVKSNTLTEVVNSLGQVFYHLMPLLKLEKFDPDYVNYCANFAIGRNLDDSVLKLARKKGEGLYQQEQKAVTKLETWRDEMAKKNKAKHAVVSESESEFKGYQERTDPKLKFAKGVFSPKESAPFVGKKPFGPTSKFISQEALESKYAEESETPSGSLYESIENSELTAKVEPSKPATN